MRPQHAHGLPGGGIGCILCSARSVACNSMLQGRQDEWRYCFILVTVVIGNSSYAFQAPHVVQDLESAGGEAAKPLCCIFFPHDTSWALENAP